MRSTSKALQKVSSPSPAKNPLIDIESEVHGLCDMADILDDKIRSLFLNVPAEGQRTYVVYDDDGDRLIFLASELMAKAKALKVAFDAAWDANRR